MEAQEQEAGPSAKKRKSCKLFCSHCSKMVSRSTWYRHYSEFCDQTTGVWEREPGDTGSTDFVFSSSDDESDSNMPWLVQGDHTVGVDFYCADSEMEPLNFQPVSDVDQEDIYNTELWESSDEEDCDETSELPIEYNISTTKLVGFLTVFLLTWQAVFRVANISMAVMFKFMSLFLLKISDVAESLSIRHLYEIFPTTLLKAQVMNSINRDNFRKLIVCPKCHSTYEESDCAGEMDIPKCSHIRFPKHPQQRMRQQCGEILLKSVRTALGKKIFSPLKVFCYKSIIESIACFVQQPGMLDIFNHWKNREVPNGVMSDVYDAVVWKSFLSVDGEDLLVGRYTLGLLINVDWFQPYKHISYSVGAIYLSILNFPRQIRNRRENIIVVGIIPGPNEPKIHMNSFLELLVQELLKLRKGVEMKTPEGQQIVRALLLCSASDIPASRKLGGFLGHAASKGCSRCLKSFPTDGFGQKTDFSGFDRDMWPRRTVEEHRRVGMLWKHATTLANRHALEQKHGVRFSELLRIPYFDTVRYVVVDPMHNMFLGTAKRMVTIWKDNGLIPETEFDNIQTTVNQFVTPADIGQIPHKIASQFSSFTADQWKNWTLIYSPVILKPIIPDVDYQCWCLFVDACRLLSSRAISHDGIEKMDSLIVRFCKVFEQLYGALSCTPNMHLHCHIKQCLLDFGPAGSFWAFPFERLNGVLGSVPTNHQAIETQLMRKFCTNQQVIQALKNGEAGLQELFQPFVYSKGSLKHEEISEMPLLCPLSVSNIETQCETCKMVPPIKEACLSGDEHKLVDDTLKNCFGDAHIRTMRIYRYCRAIHFGGDLYGSVKSIHSNSAMLYAKNKQGHTLPCFVNKYLKVTIVLTSDNMQEITADLYMAAVNWLEEHPQKNWFNSPVEVWRKFLPCSFPESFIPVPHIKCRCAYIEHNIKFNHVLQETVTTVIPINNFYGL